MISAVDIEVYGGYYEIVPGMDFNISDSGAGFVTYEDSGVWHIKGDPCRGRVADAVITIPYDLVLRRFSLAVRDGAFYVKALSAREIVIDGANSAGELEVSRGDYISLSVGKGTLRANIKECTSADIECGSGSADITLGKAEGGYSISAKHGVGSITLDSVSLPREYQKSGGKSSVCVVCGMGSVNLYT